MENVSAITKETAMKEAARLKENQEPLKLSSQKPKKIGLGIMLGTGILVGMMISFALSGSLVNLGGMLGGALTGLFIHYSS
jgi:hypothetical protein